MDSVECVSGDTWIVSVNRTYNIFEYIYIYWYDSTMILHVRVMQRECFCLPRCSKHIIHDLHKASCFFGMVIVVWKIGQLVMKRDSFQKNNHGSFVI